MDATKTVLDGALIAGASILIHGGNLPIADILQAIRNRVGPIDRPSSGMAGIQLQWRQQVW